MALSFGDDKKVWFNMALRDRHERPGLSEWRPGLSEWRLDGVVLRGRHVRAGTFCVCNNRSRTSRDCQVLAVPAGC